MNRFMLFALVLWCGVSNDALADAILVRISPDGGMSRGGKPYFIKGVGGDTRLEEMKRCGVNSFRTWSDEKLGELLPAAEKLGLTVCAGIWLEPDSDWFSYRNPENCARQAKRVREVIEKHKNAPALLCWGLGNEAEGDGKSAAFWKQIDRLAELAHEIDPAHPTMTALAGITPEKAAGLNEHAPRLDFIGINTYGGLHGLREGLSKMGWKRPWVVTEYGPLGYWECAKTPWGAPLEQTSSAKAAFVREGYSKAIAPDGNCMGGYAFIWGQKQEASATWFGLFTKSGERTATVDALEEIWTGKRPANLAPAVKQLTVSAEKNTVKAGERFNVKVEANDPDGDALSFRWEVTAETGKRDKEGRELPIDPTPGCVDSARGADAEIVAPKAAGRYRLYVYVLDGKGHAGTATAPFQVK